MYSDKNEKINKKKQQITQPIDKPKRTRRVNAENERRKNLKEKLTKKTFVELSQIQTRKMYSLICLLLMCVFLIGMKR